jgi:hypothetical protein
MPKGRKLQAWSLLSLDPLLVSQAEMWQWCDLHVAWPDPATAAPSSLVNSPDDLDTTPEIAVLWEHCPPDLWDVAGNTLLYRKLRYLLIKTFSSWRICAWYSRLEQGSPHCSTCVPLITSIYRSRARDLRYRDSVYLNKSPIALKRLLNISYYTCG